MTREPSGLQSMGSQSSTWLRNSAYTHFIQNKATKVCKNPITLGSNANSGSTQPRGVCTLTQLFIIHSSWHVLYQEKGFPPPQLSSTILKVYSLSFYFERSSVLSCICQNLCDRDNICFYYWEFRILIPVLLLNHCIKQIISLHFLISELKSVKIKAFSKPEVTQIECFANRTFWRWLKILQCRRTRSQCCGKIWIQSTPCRPRDTQVKD